MQHQVSFFFFLKRNRYWHLEFQIRVDEKLLQMEKVWKKKKIDLLQVMRSDQITTPMQKRIIFTFRHGSNQD